MNDRRDDERREPAELARLERLFRADAGPSPSDVAAARLLLKRTLARERGEADGSSGGGETSRAVAVHSLRRLVSPRALRVASQAVGFALLVALLVPVLPRVLPAGFCARPGVDVVASLADEARFVRERFTPWLPSLPPLDLPRPSMAKELRSGGPASGLFDWIPSLHSDAR
jgi:hypothetical protein